MKRTSSSSPSAKLKDNSQPASKKLKVTSLSDVASSPAQADGKESGGEWTRVERRKGKKVKKNDMKNDASPPKLMYSPTVITKRSHAIAIDDVRDLVLHLTTDSQTPQWVQITNKSAINKAVVLLVPGVTRELLALPPVPTSATANPNLPIPIPLPDGSSDTILPFIAKTYSHACPTRAPGDNTRMHSVLGAFFNGPVTGTAKEKMLRERLKSEQAAPKDPALYTLTLEQMVENNYPIPSYMADIFEKPDGWVETPEEPKQSLLDPRSQHKGKAKVYAIDCEMCLTESGKELTRVCMIDYYSGIVVYDQLVKPQKPIIDYLTRWSGITAEALAPVTATLADVQAQVLRIVSPTAESPSTPILVGHSLESDLRAMKLCHPRCIDTAVTFHHSRGRPLKPGLAWLTKKWCNREIQTRGEGGHDPEEDARACLDLLKKKVDNGPGYGQFKTDQESIFEKMARSQGRSGQGGVRGAVVDHGNPAVMHGAKATTNVSCKSDDEVVDGLLSTIPSHDFTFGRFTSLADTLGWLTPKATSDMPAPPTAPATDPSPDELKTVVTALNARLEKVYDALPPRSVFILLSGHSDPRRMSALHTRKSIFDSAIRNGRTTETMERSEWWTSEDSRLQEEEVERAKRGLLFMSIKPAKPA